MSDIEYRAFMAGMIVAALIVAVCILIEAIYKDLAG